MDINDAGFNLLLILENITLLEDHFLIKKMNCSKCILKHILKISGYSREASTLNNANLYYPYFDEILEWIGAIYSSLLNGSSYAILGQNVRQNRQKLIDIFMKLPQQQPSYFMQQGA